MEKVGRRTETGEKGAGLRRKGIRTIAAALALALALGCPASAMSGRNRKVVEMLKESAVRRYGKESTTRGEGRRWSAHRGLSDVAPENTEAAIELAGMCGAEAVEVDVRMTKDGKLILMHDSTVDRMTNGSGRVDEMTRREISKLKITGGANAKRFRNLRVCSFDKCLKICRKYGMSVYVELKYERKKQFRKKVVRKTYKALKKHGMLDKCEIISFSVNLLKEWKKIDKNRNAAARPLFRDGCSSRRKKSVKKKYTLGEIPDEMKGLAMMDAPPKRKGRGSKAKTKKK